MTGLIILSFMPLAAAVFFLIRMRAEQKARLDAEERARLLQDRTGAGESDRAEWNAVLGHELRSPAAAILGYQELLEEGTFGALPPAAGEAIQRIRLAADQLLFLVDAVERSSAPPDDIEDAAPFPARDLIAEAVAAVRFEAESRDTAIDIADSDVVLVTRPADARRAIILVLGAAIKASPGVALRLSADDRAIPRISVIGARFDPARDTAAAGGPLSGATLRLELARSVAALAGGSLEVTPAGAVHLLLPRLAIPTPHGDPGTVIDGAEHLP